MGADSSTLKSIDALSNTLVDIEKRLTEIEDVQIHHERTMALDNTVIISGKKIACRADVTVIVGPIIGKLTTNSVRIMVETNVTATITLNAFLADEMSTYTRFQFEERLDVVANTPKAVTFGNLLPNTRYFLYIGGVNYNDTVLNYCTFKTLPADSNVPVRFLSLYNTQVDQLSPSNSDILGEIQTRLEKYDVNANANTFITSGNVDGGDRGVDNSRIHGILHIGNTVSLDKFMRAPAIDLANSLCQDECVDDNWIALIDKMELDMANRYRQVLSHPKLRYILRHCSNIFLAGPMESLMETISFFTISEHKEEQETKKDGDIDKESSNGGQVGNSDVGEKIDGVGGSSSAAGGAPASAKESAKAALARSKAEREEKKKLEAEEKAEADRLAAGGLKILKKRGEEIDIDTDDDAIGEEKVKERKKAKEAELAKQDDSKQTPPDQAMQTTIAKTRKKMLKSMDERLLFNRSMEESAAGLIARAARRVFWRYCRLLWDDNCDVLVTSNSQQEVLLRKILSSRREVELKRRLLSALNQTRLRLLREFGEEYGAVEKVALRYSGVNSELKALETKLMAIVNESVLLQSYTMKEISDGAFLHLGKALLIIIDTSWSIIGSNGEIDYLQSRETLLKDSFTAEAESYLMDLPPPMKYDDVYARPISVPGRGGGGVDTDGRGEKAVGVMAVGGKWANRRSVQFDSVIVVSSGPLVRSSVAEIANNDKIDSSTPVSVRVSLIDSKRLFELLFKWRQLTSTRSSVAIFPPFNINKSAMGYIAPHVDLDPSFSWNFNMARVTSCFFGQITRTGHVSYKKASASINPLDDNINNLGNYAYNMDGSPLVNDVPNLSVTVSAATITSKPIFYDLTFVPYIEPSEGTPMGRAASVKANAIVSDCDMPIVSLGPIVGRVTSSSASILLETANTTFVKMIVSDQITGLEFQNVLLCQANQPAVFLFDSLQADRAYDILVQVARKAVSRSNTPNGISLTDSASTYEESDLFRMLDEFAVVVGSFYTPRGLIFDDEVKDNETVQKLRAVAHELEQALSSAPSIYGHDGIEKAPFTSTIGLALNSKLDSNSNSKNNKKNGSTNAQGGGGGGGGEEGEIDGSTFERPNRYPWRTLIVGNHQPNSSILSKPFDYSQGPDNVHKYFDALSADRSNIHDGIKFARIIGDFLSNSWNGCDLTIHVGLNVDLSYSIHNVVQNLTLAERASNLNANMCGNPARFNVSGLYLNDLAYFEGSKSMSPEMRRYIDLAEADIRTAYRLHWSATTARPLLANGSHMIVSCPFLDVLNAFNVTSWRMLSRELSAFTSKWFFYLLCKVQGECENLTWSPDISIAPSPKQTPASMKSAMFYRNGEIGLFQMKLNFVFAQDSFGTRSDGLLSEEQFQELSYLLRTDFVNDNSTSSHHQHHPLNDIERAMGTLVLILPVPLLSDFGGNQENSATYSCGLRYTPSEVLRLLDLLSNWLEEFPSREVILVSGGSMTGFQSTIYSDPFDQDNNNNDNDNDNNNGGDNRNHGSADSFASDYKAKRPSTKITQLCVGGFVGHIGDFDVPLSDELFSGSRRFLFEHFDLQTRSHIACVEVETKQFESWEYSKSRFFGQNEFVDISPSWNLMNADNSSQGPEAGSLSPYLLLASSTSNMLPQLWHVVKGHIQYYHLNRSVIASDPISIPASVDKRAMHIMEGISNVFIRDDLTWRRLHNVLKKSRYFDLAFTSGPVMFHNIMSIFSFAFGFLGETDVFHVPSSFVIRKVWDKFTMGYIHIESSSHSSDTAITGDTVLAGCESVVANLSVDSEYFIKFMRQIMEVQILMEYFCTILGVLD